MGINPPQQRLDAWLTYQNEAEIKRALGIESWRNLSKEKMMKFAVMMPDMDTEVALKIIEQFPEFKEFALMAVDVMERVHGTTLSANSKSQERVHQAFSEIRAILKDELQKDDLTWEQRKYLIDQIQETGRSEAKKDTENKQFLEGMAKKVLIGAGAAVALGVAFVGGRVIAGGQDSPNRLSSGEDDPDDPHSETNTY